MISCLTSDTRPDPCLDSSLINKRSSGYKTHNIIFIVHQYEFFQVQVRNFFVELRCGHVRRLTVSGNCAKFRL